MAKINGTNLVLEADFGDGLGMVAVGFSEDCKLMLDHSPAKATTKDSNGWEESIGGLKKWTMDCNGLTDFHPSNTEHNVASLYTILNNRSSVKLNFTLQNPASGDVAWTGQAFITKLEMDAKLEEAVTYTASFQGTAALNMASS